MLGLSKTRKEIAAEYGISRKTFYNWLKTKKIQIDSTLITPKEQEEIYKVFGVPCFMNSDERVYYTTLYFKTARENTKS